MNEFETFLKKHRITQYKFGKITGIPTSTLSDIKKGINKIPPYFSYLFQLMEFKKSKTGEF